MKLKKKETFEPRAGTILVKPLKREKQITTEGGLIIDEAISDYASAYVRAKVVKVGKNFLNYKMETEVGDVVLVTKSLIDNSDRWIIINGEKHYQIEERDYFWGKIK